jgi:Tfp pilus assembly protein PilF
MRVSAAIALALLAVPAPAAGWLRLRASGIELLTDAGEPAARAALDRFGDIRRVLAEPDEGPDAGLLSLRVFLFRSNKEFRAYADGAATAGFYQSGPERDYIVLPVGAELSRALAHEYIHLVLHHGAFGEGTPLPQWFEEGTAELYSNLSIRHGRVTVGAPIREHEVTLQEEKWLTADQLASVTKTSPYYNERGRAGVFYAESWALVHMINLAPDWRKGMPRFAALLAEGRDSREAFQQAFGRSMDQALKALPGDLRELRAVRVEAPPEESHTAIASEPMSDLDAALARADLALQVRHLDLARSLFEQIRQAHPDSPQAQAGLGSLALARDDRDEARRLFEKAIAMGSRDADTYFQLAMLERDAGTAPGRVHDLLERTLALDPRHAEALFLLGLAESEAGNYAAAAKHLREAARVQPGQSSFWNALAYAQSKLGQTGAARTSALRAVRTADTPEQERMGQALLDALH